MALPFPDRSFDAVTIAFGIRNVTQIDQALREARRVLRPGGRFLCLEFSKVVAARAAASSTTPIPSRWSRCSAAVSPGTQASYRYLVESIRRFPDQRGVRGADARGRLRAGPLPQSVRRRRGDPLRLAPVSAGRAG